MPSVVTSCFFCFHSIFEMILWKPEKSWAFQKKSLSIRDLIALLWSPILSFQTENYQMINLMTRSNFDETIGNPLDSFYLVNPGQKCLASLWFPVPWIYRRLTRLVSLLPNTCSTWLTFRYVRMINEAFLMSELFFFPRKRLVNYRRFLWRVAIYVLHRAKISVSTVSGW